MSEPTPENINPTEQAPPKPTEQNTDKDIDWQKEAEKWKALSRKHEGNWQAASKERDEIKTAHMSDADKAIAEARASARSETLSEVRGQLGEAELKAAAGTAGVALPESLSALLDTSRLINEDGSTNTELISQIVGSFQPGQPTYSQNVGVGPQSSTGVPGQLTRDDLSRMTTAEIVKARKEGKLNHFLSGGT